MLITFNNVSLQYTDKRILDNVSFTINDNAKLGIIGINGAGKSSILKLIVGHAIEDITEKVYTHRTIEQLKSEIEKII